MELLRKRVIWTLRKRWSPMKKPQLQYYLLNSSKHLAWIVMLKEGIEHLEQRVRNIFRECLALGYVPTSLQKIKTVFIPKPWKDN